MIGDFEIGHEDKILSWRDYFGVKEVESQLAWLTRALRGLVRGPRFVLAVKGHGGTAGFRLRGESENGAAHNGSRIAALPSHGTPQEC